MKERDQVTNMDILEALQKRRSIRGYRPDPVPRVILQKVLEAAGRAPSAMNSQPWEFAVITGEPLEKIREENIAKLRAQVVPEPDHQVVGWTMDSVYRKRQVELAKGIFRIMGIPREDREKRAAWMERGFRYFDAPAAIILLADKTLTEIGPALDLGAVMQNICLAALSYGLGTCIHDQGVLYPEVLRRHAGIPGSKRIIIAISIGYPDEDNIVNTIASTREPTEALTRWIGFP